MSWALSRVKWLMLNLARLWLRGRKGLTWVQAWSNFDSTRKICSKSGATSENYAQETGWVMKSLESPLDCLDLKNSLLEDFFKSSMAIAIITSTKTNIFGILTQSSTVHWQKEAFLVGRWWLATDTLSNCTTCFNSFMKLHSSGRLLQGKLFNQTSVILSRFSNFSTSTKIKP